MYFCLKAQISSELLFCFQQLEKRLEEEKLKLKRSEEKVKESAQQATPSVSNESLIKERSALQVLNG